MGWPEGRDFGVSSVEVTHTKEAPPYNELSEDEKHYILFTNESCHTVGNYHK